MPRVDVQPSMLQWALDRADLNPETKRYERFASYASGEKAPTMTQLQEFAKATHVPFGTLFLPEPPREVIPIPDYRTIRDHGVAEPSANLLDTIYEAQMRQDWYRGYAIHQGADPLEFYGSVTVRDSIMDVASRMRASLKFDMNMRGRFRTWEEALRHLIDAVEATGVLVMISGVVGNNTHRKLAVDEFRGFTLGDPIAPVIFINGSDSKSAQMFTLIHELAHVWLGESGVSNSSMETRQSHANERWANALAAEVLVPLSVLRADYTAPLHTVEVSRLAKKFKASTLVIIKRIHDAHLISWDDYVVVYRREEQRLNEIMNEKRKSPGGDYYNSRPLQISQEFSRAVITDAYEGRTLYRDAFRLLGTVKTNTFDELAKRLGVA